MFQAEEMLQHGAVVNAFNQHGATPLHWVRHLSEKSPWSLKLRATTVSVESPNRSEEGRHRGCPTRLAIPNLRVYDVDVSLLHTA